jgi:hypothetical protein
MANATPVIDPADLTDDDPDEARKEAEKAYKAAGNGAGGPLPDFRRTSKGEVIPKSFDNMRLGIKKLGYALSYNEFTMKPLAAQDGGALEVLEDPAIVRIRIEIADAFRFTPAQSGPRWAASPIEGGQ